MFCDRPLGCGFGHRKSVIIVDDLIIFFLVFQLLIDLLLDLAEIIAKRESRRISLAKHGFSLIFQQFVVFFLDIERIAQNIISQGVATQTERGNPNGKANDEKRETDFLNESHKVV